MKPLYEDDKCIVLPYYEWSLLKQQSDYKDGKYLLACSKKDSKTIKQVVDWFYSKKNE